MKERENIKDREKESETERERLTERERERKIRGGWKETNLPSSDSIHLIYCNKKIKLYVCSLFLFISMHLIYLTCKTKLAHACILHGNNSHCLFKLNKKIKCVPKRY